MKKFLTALVYSILIFSSVAHSESFLSSKEFSFSNDEPKLMKVDEAFVFDYKQTGNQLKISFVIADGYYMYRDKLKFSTNGATLAEINLPKGKIHHDDYFGEQEVYTSYIELPIGIKQANKDSSVSVTFMGCAEGKLCYPPTTRKALLTSVALNDGNISPDKETQSTSELNSQSQQNKQVVSEQDRLSQLLSNNNFALTLLIFFGLGIGLALTPCVFPMYPILSGIIVGQKQKLSTAKAFTLSMAYVQGMAITYSILGLIVASAGLKYQAALQHPYVLITLAILFALLSLSMFGLYDLKMPSRWQQKMNQLSNNQKGGNLTGVFMMGVISGLVASPCTTAPLSGALIYVAQSGNLLLGFLTLYVLSMGMGLPLIILGTSGGKLLPRAGRWMEIIKTIFGFLLIAVSIVMIGRIWPGEVSDVLWSVWGLVLTGYLMHQNKLTEFSWKQSARSVLLLLALLASVSYGFQSIMGHMHRESISVNSNVQASNKFITIKTIEDLDKQLLEAKQAGKPVLVDFYADWCVACKEFINITFKDVEVKKRFKNIVLLKADVTKSDTDDNALLERYHVLGLPTLLLFNSHGEQMKNLTITGFMGPKDFADHLDLLLK